MAATKGAAAPRGMMVAAGGRYAVISASETNNALVTGAGRLAAVHVWGTDAGTGVTIKIYDALTAVAPQIWGWATAQGLGTFAVQIPFQVGLTIVTAGTFMTDGGVTLVYEGAAA